MIPIQTVVCTTSFFLIADLELFNQAPVDLPDPMTTGAMEVGAMAFPIKAMIQKVLRRPTSLGLVLRLKVLIALLIQTSTISSLKLLLHLPV
jgi:hypothetical protein